MLPTYQLPPDLHVGLAEVELRIHKANDKNTALQATLNAADLCLRVLSLTLDKAHEKQFEKRFNHLLQHAENIKACDQGSPFIHAMSPAAMRQQLKEPISSRALSTREEIILLQGSKLHGSIFPPWKSPPDASEFELQPDQSYFADKPDLRLSGLQSDIFNGWRRPDQIFTLTSSGSSSSPAAARPTMIARASIDLVQDVTTDCSVVASLCACTATEKRGHSKMLTSNIYPYDQHIMEPAISLNGKYIFRLHFNGCFRKVIIDERLPSSRTERALHVIDRSNPGLLWPALFEKAYLKVRGGYEFPGSNSGTDLWVLTGWIPEQLFLQSDDVVPNAVWHRMFNAFRYGDIIITLGTGKLTSREEELLGLVGEHDYAVIDMKELGSQRLFLVKNPWSEGTVGQSNTAPIQNDVHCVGAPMTTPGVADSEAVRPGMFWLDLSNIVQNFESIYLNWNPGLFSFREDVHFTWDLTVLATPVGSFSSNPQYEVRSSCGGTVWLLLSRHLKSDTLAPAGPEPGSSQNTGGGFVSLYAFGQSGQRVQLSDGALFRGPYVDSPNTLLRLELPFDTAYTVVVSEQLLPRDSHNFSLSAFSLGPVTVTQAREKYPHCTSIEGAWTFSTSGGNASSRSYHLNPQFSLHLPASSDVSLLIETSVDDLPVHTKLLWGSGKRITHVTTQNILGDSGEYRRGSAFAEILDVQAGDYTIICSTFERGQTAKFKMLVSTTSGCAVRCIPLDEAGRLVNKLQVASFSPGSHRLLAPLMIGRITRLRLVARPCNASPMAKVTSRSPLKLTIELGQGPMKQVLAVSGKNEFIDNPTGVRTQDVDMLPGMCNQRGIWIVLERLGGSELPHVESVDVDILSDGPITVGAWGIGDG